MDILLSSEIFLNYFQNFSKVVKSDTDRAIDILMHNKSIRFVISRSLVEIIEESLCGTDFYESIYSPMLTHIITDQSINVKADKDETEKDIYVSMDTNYNALDSNVKRDIYLHISTQEFSLSKPYSIEIDKIIKPNKHFIGLHLASNASLSFRYFDFSNNAQVVAVCDFLIGIQNHISHIYLYDRQVSLEHIFFNSFEKKYYVHYYTKFRRGYDLIDAIDSIKDKFSKYRLFTASHKIIHERRIIINNTILEADDDFGNLTIDKPTWRINIEYSDESVAEILNKNKSFSEIRIRR